MNAFKRIFTVGVLTGTPLTFYGVNRLIEKHRVERDTYDYIIVGGGTAGCATAYFLTKKCNNNSKILLLEGGPGDLVNPLMSKWFDNWSKTSVVHETVSTSNGYCPPVGSSHVGLGGCSTHDTRITYIPPDEQLKYYSEQLGITLDDLKTKYNEVLSLMPINQSAKEEEMFKNIMINSLPSLKQTDDLQIVNNSIGFVNIAMNKDEVRWTTRDLLYKLHRKYKDNESIFFDILCSYINGKDDVVDENQNVLYVQTKSLVDKIVFDKDMRARSVKLLGNKEYYLSEKGEIILSAGSLGTPGILQRSGIGPKKVLNDAGVDILLENEEVGHGVDHVEVPVTYEYNDKWNNNGNPPRGGAMAWPMAIFFGNKGDEVPDVMVHLGLSAPPYGNNEVVGTPNCTQPDVSCGFKVEITSKDPRVPTKLVHTKSDKDMEVLKTGVEKTIEFFEHLKINGVVKNRISPSENEDIMEYIKTNTGTAFHWMSTCKCGKDGDVGDENFRLRSVKNVRLTSGAALPCIPIGNPHLTITVMSLCMVEKIVSKIQ